MGVVIKMWFGLGGSDAQKEEGRVFRWVGRQ